MKSLSDRQKRILDFIHDFLRKRGRPPTVRDIRDGCQLSSTSVVHYNLKVLERVGLLHRMPRSSRGIELPRGLGPLVRVPLIGQIAAGEPIPVLAPDTWEAVDWSEALELPQELTQGKEGVYALRVRGTSMIDALIDDGDIVLMQHAESAENGEMVAVWLRAEKEVTLKRLYREDGRIRLQPANREMAPFYVEAQNVEVQGRVIGVIRQVR